MFPRRILKRELKNKKRSKSFHLYYPNSFQFDKNFDKITGLIPTTKSCGVNFLIWFNLIGDQLDFYYIIKTSHPQVKVSTINGIHWRARLFFFTQMRTMGTESPLRLDIFGSSSAKAISSILNS